MRIGIIASARYPIREPFAGGLEKHTYDLATGLEAIGHDVTVFAAEDSDPGLDVEPVCGNSCHVDLSEAAMDDPRSVPEPFMRTHHAYLHLMMELRDRDFDVIQNSSLHYLPVSLAPIVPAPFVTTLHTPPTAWLQSALSTGPDDLGSTFVSVSRTNAASWQPHVEVTTVIPNGIDLQAWPYSPSGDPSTVVWSGRLVPEKGAHLAVEAAHAAGRRILVAGPQNGDGYADAEVFGRLGPDDEYLGHLNQEELAEVVGGAGVFLCTPQWEEPFGLVVAEALACGTPVAAFDRGAVHEVIDDATGVLAEPGDIGDLADAIERAVDLDRARCRRRAESEFSVARMIQRYGTLYDELAT